jgi:hypothetical protein
VPPAKAHPLQRVGLLERQDLPLADAQVHVVPKLGMGTRRKPRASCQIGRLVKDGAGTLDLPNSLSGNV